MPNRTDSKKTMLWYFIATLLKTKNKEKLLKAAREKWQITYRGLMFDWSQTTHQKAQRQKDSGTSLKSWKEKVCEQNSTSLKISFKSECEIKPYSDKRN